MLCFVCLFVFFFFKNKLFIACVGYFGSRSGFVEARRRWWWWRQWRWSRCQGIGGVEKCEKGTRLVTENKGAKSFRFCFFIFLCSCQNQAIGERGGRFEQGTS